MAQARLNEMQPRHLLEAKTRGRCEGRSVLGLWIFGLGSAVCGIPIFTITCASEKLSFILGTLMGKLPYDLLFSAFTIQLVKLQPYQGDPESKAVKGYVKDYRVVR